MKKLYLLFIVAGALTLEQAAQAVPVDVTNEIYTYSWGMDIGEFVTDLESKEGVDPDLTWKRFDSPSTGYKLIRVNNGPALSTTYKFLSEKLVAVDRVAVISLKGPYTIEDYIEIGKENLRNAIESEFKSDQSVGKKVAILANSQPGSPLSEIEICVYFKKLDMISNIKAELKGVPVLKDMILEQLKKP